MILLKEVYCLQERRGKRDVERHVLSENQQRIVDFGQSLHFDERETFLQILWHKFLQICWQRLFYRIWVNSGRRHLIMASFKLSILKFQ